MGWGLPDVPPHQMHGLGRKTGPRSDPLGCRLPHPLTPAPCMHPDFQPLAWTFFIFAHKLFGGAFGEGVQEARGVLHLLELRSAEGRPPPNNRAPRGPRSARSTARGTTRTRTCRTWRRSFASGASAWRRSCAASCTRGTSCTPWRAKVRCPLPVPLHPCSPCTPARRDPGARGWLSVVAGFVFRARVPHSRGSGDETRPSTGGGVGWGGEGGGQRELGEPGVG